MNPLTQYVVKTSPIDKNAILLPNKETTRLLQERGLKDVQSEYILLTPFDGKWAQWLEMTLKNIPLGAQYLTWGHTI